MAAYQVTFARSARRELQALEQQLARRILAKIEQLASDPRPAGSQKLRGSGQLWRVRVGDYRIVYGIDDQRGAVDVVVIRHCREVYR